MFYSTLFKRHHISANNQRSANRLFSKKVCKASACIYFIIKEKDTQNPKNHFLLYDTDDIIIIHGPQSRGSLMSAAFIKC